MQPVVGWKRRTDELGERSGKALRLLAAEAAVAIERDDLLGRLRETARTDELTGVANRRSWDDGLAEAIARAKRDRHPLRVAMLDLDRFKAYNDERGHQAGDRLKRSPRAVRTMARARIALATPRFSLVAGCRICLNALQPSAA